MLRVNYAPTKEQRLGFVMTKRWRLLKPLSILKINLLRLFVALACAALNLRNKQLSILVALSAAIALIAALLGTLNVLSYVKYMFGRI